MSLNAVTVNATAADTFTDWLLVRDKFNLSISGTWVGTVTAQRKFGSTGLALDVDSWTGGIETYGVEAENDVFHRAGFKVGDYTSGSATLRISQD